MKKLIHLIETLVILLCGTITGHAAQIPDNGYLINVCGLHLGASAAGNAVLFDAADTSQRLAFTAVGDGYYTISANNKFLSMNGEWDMNFTTDQGDASRFSFEDNGVFVMVKCKGNNCYMAPDHAVDSAPVYSNKSSNNAMATWYIATEPDGRTGFSSIRYAVNPAIKRQTWEGWGFTLCWWANVIGNWDDTKIDELVSWLVDDLGVRIFRYNIGGGDDPNFSNCEEHHMISNSHNDCKGARAEMEGFLDKDGTYHWDRDQAQIKVMLKIKEKCPDAIFEAFANSAPYFMTNSGCVAGNDYASDGSGPMDNLNPAYYEAFANYLVEVMKHHRQAYGIEFRTLSPINEPRCWAWYRSGSQEGCRFTDQAASDFIRVLSPILKNSGLNTVLSGVEQSDISDAKKSLDFMHNNAVLPLFAQMNTHTYVADRRNRTQTGALSKAYGLRNWMSEVCFGTENVGGDVSAAIQSMVEDLRYLQPVAWVEWQYVERPAGEKNQHGWGVIGSDLYNGKQEYTRQKRYYFDKQLMNAFRPGCRFITSLNDQSVAALNAAGDELTLVVLNTANQPVKHWVDLSLFSWVDNHPTATRTSFAENCQPVTPPVVNDRVMAIDLPPFSVTTIRVKVSQNSALNNEIVDGAKYWIIPRNAETMAVNYGGRNVDIQPVAYDAGQTWTAHAHAYGSFSFSNDNGYYLTAKTGDYYLYATQEADKDLQWFYPTKVDDIYFKLRTDDSNRVLDLEKEEFSRGTRLGTYNDNGYAGNVHHHFLIVRQPEKPQNANVTFDTHDAIFRSKVGNEHSRRIYVSADGVDSPITFNVHSNVGQSAQQFTVEPASLAGSDYVTVTYRPQEGASHWAWISASAGSANVSYVDVHGDSYAEPELSLTGSTHFDVTALGPVTNGLTLNATGLIGRITGGTWGENYNLFSLGLPWDTQSTSAITFDNTATAWPSVVAFLYDPANPTVNLLADGGVMHRAADAVDGLYTIACPEFSAAKASTLRLRFSEADSRTVTDDIDLIPGAVYRATGRAAERMPHAVPALADISGAPLTLTYTPSADGNFSAYIWLKTAGRDHNLDVPISATATTAADDIAAEADAIAVSVHGRVITARSSRDITAMELYSVTGLSLIRGEGAELDAGTLPAGVYLLRVTADDGHAHLRKLVLR